MNSFLAIPTFSWQILQNRIRCSRLAPNLYRGEPVNDKPISSLKDFKTIRALLQGTHDRIKPNELQKALSLLFANLGLCEKSVGRMFTHPSEITALFNSDYIPLNLPLMYQERESHTFLVALMKWVHVDYHGGALTTPLSYLDRGPWFSVQNNPNASSLFILGNHNKGLGSQKIVYTQYNHYTGRDEEDRLLISLPMLLLSEIIQVILGKDPDPLFALHPVLLAETDNNRPVFAQRTGPARFRLSTTVSQTFGIRTISSIP
jgi:hypothetical protein